MILSRFFTIFMLICIAFLFISCSQNNLSIGNSINDENSSLIVFSRPSSVIGHSYNLDIYEFEPENNFTTRAIASLSNDEKINHRLSSGVHYFYSKIKGHNYIKKITVDANKTYFINVGKTEDTVFYPMLYPFDRLQIKKELLEGKCTKQKLDKYLFELQNEADDLFSKYSIKRYYSPIHMFMECKDERVLKVSDSYLINSIDELNSVSLININKKLKFDKSNIENEIRMYFPKWIKYEKEIFRPKSYYMNILKDINPTHYKSYESVDVSINYPSSLNNYPIFELKNNVDEVFNISDYRKKINDRYKMIYLEMKLKKEIIRTQYSSYWSNIIVATYFDYNREKISEIEISNANNIHFNEISRIITQYTRRNLLKN